MVSGKQQARLILFDLDGTLIEFHHQYLFQQTFSILDKMGHTGVQEEMLWESFAAFDFFSFVEEHHRDEFIKQFWSHFDWSGFPQPRPLPGALVVLEELSSRGMELAITTSRMDPEKELRGKLEGTGFLEFISTIVTRPWDHVHWTDKTGIILSACEAHGCDPNQAVLVGDIPTDIQSAKEVGIGTTVAVLSGGLREDILKASQPDHLLPDVRYLRGLL